MGTSIIDISTKVPEVVCSKYLYQLKLLANLSKTKSDNHTHTPDIDIL